ncbi:unnamed protein product [Auanema sp. JU1783]|nr:unnamed protein product [Auanema sp. JU1783]
MKSFLSFLSLLALAVAKCPSDWFSDGDGMCYKIFTDLLLEPKASESCESLGGSLVMIKNAFTEAALYSQKSSTNVIWIGINCRGSQITNCYYEDGTQLTANSYNNFYPGYPDVNKGLCTYMVLSGASAGKWYNIDCNNIPFGYACQKNEDSFTSCPPGYTLRGDNCYKVLVDALSYSDAEQVCATSCGHITSIGTNDENNYVMQLAQNSSDSSMFARIGPKYNGNRYCNPCGVNCCDSVTYSNFAHPNTDLGDCVGIALTNDLVPQGNWMNTYCDKPMLSVCKTEVNMYPCQAPSVPTSNPHSTPSYTSCSSPQYYDNNGTVHSPTKAMNTPCTYIISVKKGYQAAITFKQFNFHGEKTTTLELYNDILDRTPFKTLRYTDNPVNQIFISQEESMKVIFTSLSNSVASWSFDFGPEFTAYSPTPAALGTGCNAGLLSAPGTITSPNYPNYYPDNTNCHYQLTAGANKRIYLYFSDVRTESWDVIDVYDGATTNSPHLGSLSGFFPSNTNFTSSGAFMLVTFVSDGQVSYNGFAAEFTAV